MIVAGPCAVESWAQLEEVAIAAKQPSNISDSQLHGRSDLTDVAGNGSLRSDLALNRLRFGER